MSENPAPNPWLANYKSYAHRGAAGAKAAPPPGSPPTTIHDAPAGGATPRYRRSAAWAAWILCALILLASGAASRAYVAGALRWLANGVDVQKTSERRVSLPSPDPAPAVQPAADRSEAAADQLEKKSGARRVDPMSKIDQRPAGASIEPTGAYRITEPAGGEWSDEERADHLRRWSEGCGVPIDLIRRVPDGYVIPTTDCRAGTFDDLIRRQR